MGNFREIVDPLKLAALLWPEVHFYSKQREIIYTFVMNDETVVPAGNMLGKDYIAGFLALTAFLTSSWKGFHIPCRGITTSVKDKHLIVLWGEIGRFIDSAAYPLRAEKGGPLIVNHQQLKKVIGEDVCPISYLLGMVSEKGEGMAGHHAESTFGIIDEASGVDDVVYTQMDTWAKRKLIIGNPNPTQNFFRRMVKEGDVLAT